MLLTAAMMLDWMGEEDPVAADKGRKLRTAVAMDLREHGLRPRSTTEVGEAVIRQLG
jgi:tartrate dehydrogenase/decarboxylase/D-malate dehydrogenase